jgi:hypothetical protein
MVPRLVETHREDSVRAVDVGSCEGIVMKCVAGSAR